MEVGDELANRFLLVRSLLELVLTWRWIVSLRQTRKSGLVLVIVTYKWIVSLCQPQNAFPELALTSDRQRPPSARKDTESARTNTLCTHRHHEAHARVYIQVF